jgi:glycogen operon protein
MSQDHYAVVPGRPHPLGAMPDEFGVNSSLFSEHAAAIELLLFATPAAATPCQVIPLDPIENRAYRFWHVYVRGLAPRRMYETPL